MKIIVATCHKCLKKSEMEKCPECEVLLCIKVFKLLINSSFIIYTYTYFNNNTNTLLKCLSSCAAAHLGDFNEKKSVMLINFALENNSVLNPQYLGNVLSAYKLSYCFLGVWFNWCVCWSECL